MTHSPVTSFFPTEKNVSCSSPLITGVPALPFAPPNTLEGLGGRIIGNPDGVVGLEPGVGLIVLAPGPTLEGLGIPLVGVEGAIEEEEDEEEEELMGEMADAKAEGGAEAEEGKEVEPAEAGGAGPPTRRR